ncbi:DinB family protein, partial [Brevibacillus borstelensis]
DQEAWTDNLGYDRLDRKQHMLLFQMLRASMLPLLENLTPEQLERVGQYPDGVRYTFKKLLELRVQHVRDHLSQIERVKQAFREHRL